MASVMSISTCTSMFFILNFHILVSAESIDKGGKVDWELALQKIDELQKIVHAQDERIFMLEKRPSEFEIKTLTKLQNTAKKQSLRIVQLEARIQELENVVKADENIPVEIQGNEPLSETNGTSVTPNKTFNRRDGLRNIQQTTVPVDTVAFFAYLSTDTPASVAHHIITFDKVITNVGNAYHSHQGTFFAPRTGIYVFTWTIRLTDYSKQTTELLVNNNVINWIYFNSNDSVDGSVTGTAVVQVNQGDDVLIRTGSRFHTGTIKSNHGGKSSFAGWILM